MKLTKSLPVIKERNCNASLVLDTRTNRKNVSEYPLAIRFTVDRKFFYHQVGGSYSEKRFSDICTATKSSSENYKEQKMWREDIVPKYKEMLVNLNQGNPFTYEMVRVAITTGNANVEVAKEDKSFIGIWQEYIYHLQNDDNGKRYSTSDSYVSALKSFQKFLGKDAIKGFNISVAEIQKWKDCMSNGVKGKDGNIEGQISDATVGLYLRSCRTIWNLCRSQGYLLDVTYPFSNKKEKNLVSIPRGKVKKKVYLKREQFTELYHVFINKNYPETWKKGYAEKAHYSQGLFLVQYLCNGFNMADAAELAALSKRIMLSAIHALPEIFVKLRDQIHAGSNPLLMCTLYYVYFDHGLPRSAMALSKVSLGAKQISYIRESVKAVVEKLMETSVTNALDKKAEWTKQIEDVEDTELKQAMKKTLRDTKGKHGRRTFMQEEQSIDDILIADDKETLKMAILTSLNDMEHEYETAYIKAALIRSHHLDPHISFSVFLRAICSFSGREYKYDPAQRVDTFIYREEKKFMTFSSSKWQRGRRIVSYLTDIFDTIQ